MSKGQKGKKFVFIGNTLFLDFINTQLITGEQLTDLLRDFKLFISWLERAQVITHVEAGAVTREWAGTRAGDLLLERAREFRAILRKMVERIIKGLTIKHATVDSINNILRQDSGYSQLERNPKGFEKRSHYLYKEPIHLLIPIAESAAAFLCHDDQSLIKQCESLSCVLFFYDTTKNHSRRWCSMTGCGNRMKAASHYRRKRSRIAA